MKKLNYLMGIVTLLVELLFFYSLWRLEIFSWLVILISLIVVGGLTSFLFFIYFNRKNFSLSVIVGHVFTFIFIGLLIWGNSYLQKTLAIYTKITDKSIIDKYILLVPSDSKYQQLADLEDKNIGTYVDRTISGEEALSRLGSFISLSHNEYNDFLSLINDFNNSVVDAIFLPKGYLNLISLVSTSKINNYRIISSLEVERESTVEATNVNLLEQIFAVYLSIVDSEGSCLENAISEFNMLMIVNPNSYQILLVRIPRNYIVNLPIMSSNDWISSTSLYGIDQGVIAVSELFSISINYYVKTDLEFLSGLVSTIGDISVYSKYSFSTSDKEGNTYSYVAGNNQLNGSEVLAFLRERDSFFSNISVIDDNYYEVLEGIVDKFGATSSLDKYDQILESLDGVFLTNVDKQSLYSFVDIHRNRTSNWKVNYLQLNGEEVTDYLYSLGDKEMFKGLIGGNIETIKQRIVNLYSST